MNSATIYTRVSSHGQGQDGHAEQEQNVRGILARHGIDCENARVIRETGSADNGQHTDELAKLLNDVKDGKITVIGLADLTRLSRRPELTAIIDEIVAHGGRVISEDGFDSDQSK